MRIAVVLTLALRATAAKPKTRVNFAQCNIELDQFLPLGPTPNGNCPVPATTADGAFLFPWYVQYDTALQSVANNAKNKITNVFSKAVAKCSSTCKETFKWEGRDKLNNVCNQVLDGDKESKMGQKPDQGGGRLCWGKASFQAANSVRRVYEKAVPVCMPYACWDADKTAKVQLWEDRLVAIFCGKDTTIAEATNSPKVGCKFEIKCGEDSPYPWMTLILTTTSIIGMGLGVFVIRFAWYYCTDRELGCKGCRGRNLPTGHEDAAKDYKALRGMNQGGEEPDSLSIGLMERT